MKKSKHRISKKQYLESQPAQRREFLWLMKFNTFSEGKEVQLFLAVLLIVVVFVFKDFLFLKNVYLFKDIGSDSINGFFPSTVHLVDYLKSEGIPKWSFYQGMGQSLLGVVTFDPFLLLFYVVGRDNVAYVIAYVEVFKIIVAGVFFFLYLRTLSVSKYSAVVGGLLYSFTGYMILGGGWYIFSYDAMCVSLLLYGFERFFKHNVWYLLPIPIALAAAYQPFYLYLYVVLLLVYGVVRFVEERGWNLKRLTLFYLKLSAPFLLGLAISAVFLFSNVSQLLQSPRVGGEAAYFQHLLSQPVFGLAPPIEYISILLRTFSSDLLGTGNSFKGWVNYLESPLTYCGLICLLLAPQFFISLDRRRRVLFSLTAGACIVSLIFPFFRYVFWGFTGDYFRTFSFFLALGVLYLSAEALSNLDIREKLNVKVLFASLAMALVVLYIPFDQKNQIVDQDLRSVAAVLLVIYTAVLIMMRSRTKKALAQGLLLLTICIELAYFSSITINKRDVLTSKELGQKTGYNDFTNEAAAFVHSLDHSFFRVTKDYSSGPAIYGSLNDAKIQGYYGTTSYHSFNQKYYVEFLQAVGVIHVGNELQTRWARGLTNRPLLRITGSVKYIFTKRTDNYLNPQGYDYLNTFGDVSVFRSKYALPLGFTYDTFILESDFATLSQFQKDVALVRAGVVPADQKENTKWFQSYALMDTATNYTFADLEKDTRARREDTLRVDFHSQNIFKGSIHIQKKKLLFFSIPYDKGWSARVDGHEARLDRVNIGFMGLWLERGTHSVELEFEPPYLRGGAVVSLISLLLYGFLFVRDRTRKRMSLVNQERRTDNE